MKGSSATRVASLVLVLGLSDVGAGMTESSDAGKMRNQKQ